MYLGDAFIMLTGLRPWATSPALIGHGPQMLTVITAEVEAHHETSKREGAKIWGNSTKPSMARDNMVLRTLTATVGFLAT
jgi:hypothetical protein